MWPCIVTNFFLIKPTDALIYQIYFCQETLHISGSSSVLSWSCSKAVIKIAWHIPVPNVQWKTPDDGQRNYPKHVEFLDKNKFGKLMRLLVLLKTNGTYPLPGPPSGPAVLANLNRLPSSVVGTDWKDISAPILTGRLSKKSIRWHRYPSTRL
jgi:hypothetical protein